VKCLTPLPDFLQAVPEMESKQMEAYDTMEGDAPAPETTGFHKGLSQSRNLLGCSVNSMDNAGMILGKSPRLSQ
jgi:hypothetical protein